MLIGTPLVTPNFVSPKAPVQVCPECNTPSKTIYKQGWVCLNADPVRKSRNHEKTTCPAFFKFGQGIDDKTLEFTEEFLQERTQFQGHDTEPLNPPFLTEADADAIGAFAFEEKCRKGIVCSDCGCCIRRIHWGKWICENPVCDFTYSLTPREIPASLAISNSNAPKVKTFVSKSIGSTTLDLWPGAWKVTRYDIPGEQGEIVGNVFHFKSNARLNQRPNGPDELFKELQVARLGLKRNASRCPGGKHYDLRVQQDSDRR